MLSGIEFLSLGGSLLLAALLLSQIPTTIRLTSSLKRSRRQGPSSYEPVPVLLLMCLRGHDPYLEKTLEAVERLDYPDFELVLVVDSSDDPGWQPAQELNRRAAFPVEVMIRRPASGRCGFKCESLLTGLQRLRPEHRVVALLDSDVVPPPDWLGELVAWLQQPRVGVVSGNRWFEPSAGSWPSLARYLWNVAAFVRMERYQIPWGGSLALRAELVEKLELRRRWGEALCEDTMLFDLARAQGVLTAFHPGLMMLNREDCSLSGFFHWMCRQLLIVRLYHSGWSRVCGFILSASLLQLLLGCLALWSLCQGHTQATLIAVAGLLNYLLGMLWGVHTLEAAQGRRPGVGLLGLAASIPAVQMLALAGCLRTLVMKRVQWRGIHYRIRTPFEVEVTAQKPVIEGAGASLV